MFNLISLTWIFFRANSMSDAGYIISHLFVNSDPSLSSLDLLPGGGYELAIAALAIFLMELVHWLQMRNGSLRSLALRQPAWVRWPAYFGLVLAIFMFGKLGVNEFIYAQF
jgi:hypothetical protein